jgi:hypothetical protein
MRTPFPHLATVEMSEDDDDGAPGAAITLAFRDGRTLDLRVGFATEPEHEDEVRRRIDAALRGGAATGPDGVTSHWALRGSQPGVLNPSERAKALRMAGP